MKIALLNFGLLQTDTVCELLASRRYQCESYSSCAEVVRRYAKEPFDLLVLDLHHREKETNLVQEVRRHIPTPVPILCVARLADQEVILESLDAGATDYIATPIRHQELSVRVTVLLRRAYPMRVYGERLQFGAYVFEPARERAERDGKLLDLTRKEFDLGLLFFRNLGRPLSRALIVETVWGADHPEMSRTMDTHVSRVRNKLGLNPKHGFRLAPVYGYGYRLEELTTDRRESPTVGSPINRLANAATA
ncbi:response regulator transcription factor [Noviherbaspirillum pedocola]|uniref:Response regulator transcription factor n=1 Tax=Noviherbaspirillum pedocola TaxID=2801341 RepID=A0A934SXG5_9BURK|nr:response regulator transcription factor [Noviherbaspirillum pedocola]MBK4737298.1 response regulator transcription factor [Noviherbaspirillum pedocola]